METRRRRLLVLGFAAVYLSLGGPRVWCVSAETQSSDRALMQTLAGEYDAGGVVITVTLRPDGGVTLLMPGQPLYELQPQTGLRFAIRQLPGFAVEFRRDSAGTIADMIVFQPHGDFMGVRRSGTRPDPNTLNSLVGEYRADTVLVKVAQSANNELTYIVPGQPVYQLRHVRGLRFVLVGTPGISVEFMRDEVGAVRSLVAYFSGATMAATRQRGSAPPRPVTDPPVAPPVAPQARTSAATAPATPPPPTQLPAVVPRAAAPPPPTVTRTTVVIPATIGAVTTLHLRNALTQMASFADTKRALTIGIRAAREKYWSCYPSCAELGTLGDEFATWLFAKELYYVDLGRLRAIEGRVGGSVMPANTPFTDLLRRLGGGEIDGGIVRLCQDLFYAWSGGLRGVGTDVTAVSALETSLPAYRSYQTCRDKQEFYASPSTPLRTDDPQAYVMAVLDARSAAPANMDLMLAEHSKLVSVVGAERLTTVTAAFLRTRPEFRTTPRAFERHLQDALADGATARTDPRTATIALLVEPKDTVEWAEQWKRAGEEYDKLAAVFGAERVHERAALVLEAKPTSGATDGWMIIRPARLGCTSEVPAACLREIVGVTKVVSLDVSAAELAARLTGELRQLVLDAATKLRARNELQHDIDSRNSNVRANPSAANEVLLRLRVDANQAMTALSARVQEACQAERTGGSPPVPPVAGWTHCQVQIAVSGAFARLLTPPR